MKTNFMKSLFKSAACVTSAFGLLATMNAPAASIAAWDLTGSNNVVSATATAFDTSLATAPTLIRGAGAAASAGGNSFRTVGFQNNGISTANTDYFEATLSAGSGYALSLSTIDARFAGTATFAVAPGVSAQFAYSLDGANFTLIGSPFALIGSPATNSQIVLTDISALQNVPAGTTITIRYYASGQTTTGGWGFNSPSAGAYALDFGGTLDTACPSPTATVSGDATICVGGATTIQAALTGTGPWDVTWSDGFTQTGVAASPATRNASPATTTAYTVTSVSDASSCPAGTGTGGATVTVNEPVTPAVSVTANPGTTTCAGSQVIFTAVPVNGGVSPTFVWKTNGVQDPSVPITSATYTNSILANGDTIDCQMATSLTCVTAATADAPQLAMTISTSVTPAVSVVSDHGTTICAGTTVIFTATPVNGGGAPSFIWKTNGVQDTSVPNSSATYTSSSLAQGDTVDCQLLSSDTCALPTTADAAQIVMTVNATFTPAVTIAADLGASICSNATVTFTATPINGGATPTYQWQTNSVSVVGQTASTFTTSNLKNLDAVTVVMTPSSEICVTAATATSAAITMTVDPIPSSKIIAASGVVQASPDNAAYVPDAGVGATYVWTIANGTITAGQGTAALTYAAGNTIGTLTLGCTVTTAAGCSSLSSTNIRVHAPILAGWDVSAQPGGVNNYGPSPLSATTTDANLAIGGLTRGSGVGTTGTAAARGWGGLGWNVTSAADAVTADKVATFTVTANAGFKTSFNAISRFDYRRSSTGATNGVIQYQVGGVDTFHDLVTVAYASSSSTGGSLDPIDLSGIPALQDVAAGTVVTFRIVNFGGTSTAGSWYIFDVANSPAADFEIAGYVVGCPAPTATLAGDATICVGASASLTTTLTGTQPWSVTWSDGVTSNNITSSPLIRTVSPGSTTVYAVTSVTDAINCAAGTFSGNATVTVNPLPEVSVNSATICTGDSTTLTATTSAGNPSYLWSPGGATTASITVSPVTTTLYTVTVTDGTTTCVNSGAGTVTVNPAPTVSVNSASICAGDSATLTATTSASNPSYLWSPGGATTASISVAPASTTTYSVSITDGTTTCVNSAAGTVTVNPLPTVTIAPATTNAECGGAVTFTATPAGAGPLTYQWYDTLTNAIAGETNVTLTVSNIYSAASGNYTLVVTGPACNATAVASLTWIDLVAPVITVNGANPATNECHVAYVDAGAVAIDACAGVVPVTTDNPVNANEPGIYTVTYTADDGSGNTNTATRTVSVVDTTAPLITYSFTNLTLNANSNCQALMPDVTGTNYIVAEDSCSRTVTITQTPTNNAVLTLGTNAVVLTVLDSAGNPAYATSTIVVVDVTAPVITLNGANPLTVECHGLFADPGASANDNCSGGVAVTVSGVVNPNVPGSYPIEYRASDAAGNSATNTRFVNVVDTVAPTLTLLGANPATNECHVAYIDAGAAVGDVCAGSVSVSTKSDVNVNVPGVYAFTYIANDGNGNTNTATRIVHVVDTVAPTVTVLGANPFTNYALVPFVDPGATATDACDASAAVNTLGTVDVTTPGSYTLAYIGTDASGNSTTNFRVVQVIALVTPTLAGGQKLEDGAFAVTFAGPAGQPYKLLSSPEAALTMSSWTVLTTGVFGASPTTYTDHSATNDPVRFYRISSP